MFSRTVLTHFNKVDTNRGEHLGYSYCSAWLGHGFNKKHKVKYIYVPYKTMEQHELFYDLYSFFFFNAQVAIQSWQNGQVQNHLQTVF